MIHLVYANRSNAGDWLSARAIRALLAPAEVTEHLCDEPFVAATLARLGAAPPADLAVIGGGGLLMDYFAPFWRGLLALSPPPRFCIWGAGVCAWKHASSQLDSALLAAITRQSLLCVVRDELTREAMSAAAGRVLPPAAPCPSLLAVAPPAAPGFGVLHVDHQDLLGVEGCARVDAAVRAFAARTGRPVRTTNNRMPPGDEAALQRILSLYAGADVVVTSRLHGAVLGIAHGCRVAAVAADSKIDAFLGAAGLGEWVLGPAQLGTPLLERLLARIDEQRLDGPSGPRAVVDAARQSHEAVAGRIRALAREDVLLRPS